MVALLLPHQSSGWQQSEWVPRHHCFLVGCFTSLRIAWTVYLYDWVDVLCLAIYWLVTDRERRTWIGFAEVWDSATIETNVSLLIVAVFVPRNNNNRDADNDRKTTGQGSSSSK